MSAVKHLCKHSAVSLSATRTLREQLSAIGRRPRYLRCFVAQANSLCHRLRGWNLTQHYSNAYFFYSKADG
ncbi:MAG: hypothetical protein F6K44_03940 [Moorea sp. SIO3E2]|nr:hypothetical protein [Moorena sp. SIO3E2]